MNHPRMPPPSTVADLKGAAADAMNEEPEFIEALPHDDIYRRGAMLMVIPGLRQGMHPKLLRAIKARRACHLTGACQCEAMLSEHRREDDGLFHANVRHETACPASDENLRRLLRRYGVPPFRTKRLTDEEVP